MMDALIQTDFLELRGSINEIIRCYGKDQSALRARISHSAISRKGIVVSVTHTIGKPGVAMTFRPMASQVWNFIIVSTDA